MEIIMKRIALAFPTGVQHLERVAFGIRRYANENGNWAILTNPETHFLSISSLRKWDGDGVIALINTEEDKEIISQLNCPTVNISGVFEHSPVPRVMVDYAQAGRIAADHLLDRGFQRLAFYGIRNVWYSNEYYRGFAENASKSGAKVWKFESSSSIGVEKPWEHGISELEQWLLALNKPVGLMTCSDPRAVMVIQTCHRLGLKVPDEIAIVSSNNDTSTCEFTTPTLTSVARNGDAIGFAAAKLLNELMEGKIKTSEDLVVKPVGIVSRSSTNILSIENEELSEALNYIQKNLSTPLSIESVCRHVGMSRRWLEYSLKQHLKCTPHEFVCRERVKKLSSY